MAKPKPIDEPTGTPLERMTRLARKLVAVPKVEVDKVKRREERKRQHAKTLGTGRLRD